MNGHERKAFMELPSRLFEIWHSYQDYLKYGTPSIQPSVSRNMALLARASMHPAIIIKNSHSHLRLSEVLTQSTLTLRESQHQIKTLHPCSICEFLERKNGRQDGLACGRSCIL